MLLIYNYILMLNIKIAKFKQKTPNSVSFDFKNIFLSAFALLTLKFWVRFTLFFKKPIDKNYVKFDYLQESPTNLRFDFFRSLLIYYSILN